MLLIVQTKKRFAICSSCLFILVTICSHSSSDASNLKPGPGFDYSILKSRKRASHNYGIMHICIAFLKQWCVPIRVFTKKSYRPNKQPSTLGGNIVETTEETACMWKYPLAGKMSCFDIRNTLHVHS